MDGFLAHVAETGTPTDFLSFHAKGRPSFVDGHVRMGISTQLQEIDNGFKKIAAVRALAARPIVIGESDPEGCAACPGPQNAYRNGTMYSSYTAASFARVWDLAHKHQVNLEGVLSWAFEFEDQPWFAGYRQLSTNGVNLPVLNVFRMMAKLTGERVAVESSADPGMNAIMRDGVRGAPDVSAIASLAPKKLAIMVWHYHDDDLPGADAAVQITVSGLPVAGDGARLTHYRVDETHSNAYAEWKRMGSPIAPTRPQYIRLEAAGQLERIDGPASVRVAEHQATINFALPRQGVSLIVIEWE